MRMALKFEGDIEVWQGQNWIKLKAWNQSGVQLKEIKSRRTKLNLDKIAKLKP
jgi:hypothetical protein